MRKRWRIVQHIYEGEDTEPVLTHVFYGETRERAEQVYQAHLGTDSFMRACSLTGYFRNFTCHALDQLEHLSDQGVWGQVR
jgi:hypothetical protein